MVVFSSGEYGAGKSTSIHLAAKWMRKLTGRSPRVFQIDDYGGPLRQWIDHDGRNPYPPWFKEFRYDLLARDLEEHLQNNPEVDVLIDSPLHERFKPIVQRILDNPRFATYTFRVEARRDLQLRRIEENEDRAGSLISLRLLKKKPAMWNVPGVPTQRILDNTGTRRQLEDQIRPMVEEWVEKSTYKPATPAEVDQVLSDIDSKHENPGTKMQALLFHLQDTLGFNRLGTAELLTLHHDPESAGKFLLVPHSIRAFLEEGRANSDVYNPYSTSGDALPVQVFNGKSGYHFQSSSPLMYYHRLTPMEQDVNVPYADHMYFPVGQKSGMPEHPLAAEVSGPKAMFCFYSIHKKSPLIFGELQKYLDDSRVHHWAHQMYQENDQSPNQVTRVVQKILEREASSGLRGFTPQVAKVAAALARQLNYRPSEIKQVYHAALLHRIGILSSIENPDVISPEEIRRSSRGGNRLLPNHGEDHPVIRGAAESHFPEAPAVPLFRSSQGTLRTLSDVGIFEERLAQEGTPTSRVTDEIRKRYDDDEGYRDLLNSELGDLTPQDLHAVGNWMGEVLPYKPEPDEIHPFARIVRVAAKFCQGIRSRNLSEVLSDLRENAARGQLDTKVTSALMKISQNRLLKLVREAEIQNP